MENNKRFKKNGNTIVEFIKSISEIYLSYSDELILEEYNITIIEQEKLLKQYIPKENRIDFDDKYCLPLTFKHNNAYKKDVIDGLTKLSFLKLRLP